MRMRVGLALLALLPLLIPSLDLAPACAVASVDDAACCCVPASVPASCCERERGTVPRPEPRPCGCDELRDLPPALPPAVDPWPAPDGVGVAVVAPRGEPRLETSPAASHRALPVPRERAPTHVLHCVYLI